MSKLRVLRMLSASLFGSMLLFGSSALALGDEAIPASPTGSGNALQEANTSFKIGKDIQKTGQTLDDTTGKTITATPIDQSMGAWYKAFKNAKDTVANEQEKLKGKIDSEQQRLDSANAALDKQKSELDKLKDAVKQCESQSQNGMSSCNVQQMKDDLAAKQAAYDSAQKARDAADKELKDNKTDYSQRENIKDGLNDKADQSGSACLSTGQCYQDSNTGEIQSRSQMPLNYSSLGCGNAGICTDVPLYSSPPTLGTPTGSPSAPPASIEETSGYTGSLDPGSSPGGYVPDSYTPSAAPAKVAGDGGTAPATSPNAAAANSSASNNSSGSNSNSGSGGSSGGGSPAASGSGGSSASNPFTPIATAAGVTPSSPLSVNTSADSNEMYCRVNPTGPNCPSTIQPAVKASQTKVNGDDYSGPSSSPSKSAFDSIASQALPKQAGDPGQLPQNQNQLGLPSAGNNTGDTAGRPGLATNSARSAALKAAIAGGSGFYGGSNGAISANSMSRSAAGHVPHTFGSRFGSSAMKLASTSVVGSQLNAQMGQSISRFPASMSPEVGKDGFTGPHTDLWRKVRNRYYDQSGSLNP